jgi:tetratricopeptide (TPR) repeat protein
LEDTSNGRVIRGVLFQKSEKYEDAERDFAAAIAKEPSYIAAYLCLANCHAQQEKYAEACQDLTAAIAIQPDSAAAYNLRGRVKANAEDWAGATSDFNKLIELEPRNKDAHTLRAMVWERRNEYSKAIDDYLTASAIDPSDAAICVAKGRCWLKLGRQRDSLSSFDQAIAADADCADAWRERAWLRATSTDPSIRDGQLATEDATRACALNQGAGVDDYLVLATASSEAGDIGWAMAARERVVALWQIQEAIVTGNLQRLPRQDDESQEHADR